MGIGGTGHTHTSSDDLEASAISAVSLTVSNNVTTPSLVLSGLAQVTAPGAAFRLLGVITATGGTVQAIQISNLGITTHTHTSSDDLDAGAISAVSLTVSNSISTPSLVLSGLGQITNPGSAFRLLGVITATGGTVQAIQIGNLGISGGDRRYSGHF